MKSEFKLVVFAVITAITCDTLGMKDDRSDMSNNTVTEVDNCWTSEEQEAKLDKIWEYCNHWYTKLPKDAPCFGWVAPEFVNKLAYRCFVDVLNQDFETRGSETVIHDYRVRADCFAETDILNYLVDKQVFVEVDCCTGEYIICPAGLWTRENFRSFYQNYKSKAKLK